MNIVCDWDFDDARETVHNKKAVAAALFLSFLVYSVAVAISEFKRNTDIGIKMKRYVNDVAYSQVFFFLVALLVQSITPKVFPIILVYFYVVLMAIQLVLYKSQKPVGQMVVQIL